MAQSISHQMRNAVDETLGEVENAGRAFRGFARETPYAVLGGTALAWQTGVSVVRGALELPRTAVGAARRLPHSAREGFEDLSERGHDLADRIGTGPAARRARQQARHAKRQAKGAATSAERSVRTSGRAAKRTARNVRQDAGSLPYEERTLDDLHQLASERNIEGRSHMNKDELIDALRSQR